MMKLIAPGQQAVIAGPDPAIHLPSKSASED
jgi:hypothetical protein